MSLQIALLGCNLIRIRIIVVHNGKGSLWNEQQIENRRNRCSYYCKEKM